MTPTPRVMLEDGLHYMIHCMLQQRFSGDIMDAIWWQMLPVQQTVDEPMIFTIRHALWTAKDINDDL